MFNTQSLKQLFLRFSFLITSIISISFTLWLSFPLGGRPNTAGISKIFDTVLTPVGFTFIIWSLIYLILISLGIGMAIKKVKLTVQGNYFYLISCMWICLWSVFWTALDPVLSGLALVMIMGFNVATFGELARSNQDLLTIQKPNQKLLYNLVTSGFLVYVGWTIVASVINVTIALQYGLGFDGFGITPEIWRIIILATAVVINLGFSYRIKNYTTFAVLLWAMLGIWIKTRS